MLRRFRAGLCKHEIGNDDVFVVFFKCRDVFLTLLDIPSQLQVPWGLKF